MPTKRFSRGFRKREAADKAVSRSGKYVRELLNWRSMGDSIEEIHEDWPSLSIAQIKRLIEFAHAHREQPNP